MGKWVATRFLGEYNIGDEVPKEIAHMVNKMYKFKHCTYVHTEEKEKIVVEKAIKEKEEKKEEIKSNFKSESKSKKIKSKLSRIKKKSKK